MPRHRYHCCAECRESVDNDTLPAIRRARGFDANWNGEEVKVYVCYRCGESRPWWWYSTWPDDGNFLVIPADPEDDPEGMQMVADANREALLTHSDEGDILDYQHPH